MPSLRNGADLGSATKLFLTPGTPFVDITAGSTNLGAIPHFLQSFEHEMFADGQQGKMTVSFYDPAHDLVEDVLIQSKDEIEFQYGWRAGRRSALRRGVVLTYSPRFEARGAYLDFTITDSSIRSLEEEHNETHVGRISDVVKKIIRRLPGLTVFTSGRIEATDDPEDGVWEQRNLTDLAFIDSILKPEARSLDKRTGYEFRIDGSEIYFAPPQFNAVKRSYLFARAAMGEVISFSPAYNGQAMLLQGGGNTIVEGYDPLKKTTVRSSVGLSQSPARVQMQPETVDSEIRTGRTGRYYALPFSRSADVQRWAEDKWTRVRYDAWEATADLMGDPSLLPGDIVEFRVLKADGNEHYTSGLYRIVRVVHKVQAGSFITQLTLQSDGSRLDKTENAGRVVEIPDAPDEDEEGTSVDSEVEG